MKMRALATAAVVLLFAAGPLQALPLNLTLANTPDIVAGFIQVDYNAAGESLVASGFALSLDTGISSGIAGGSFDLFANIDGDGNLDGGNFVVGGTIAALGFNSGTLLTGNLTALGFNDTGGDPLEFLFTVTGGDAAALFGLNGGILLSDAGFGGNWALGFSNTGIGFADLAALPVVEPAGLLLWMTGLLLIAGARRRS